MTTAEDSRRTQQSTEPAPDAESPFGLPDGWWPVAHSEEVHQHPAAFQLANQALALYRDLSGTVRAVVDRCPHRRLPLSMGRLTEDGSIQCGYHGWSFDGATGRCTAIPNLSADERIPNGIKVKAFSAAENIAEMLGFGLRTNQLAPAVGPPTGEEPDEGTTMFVATVLGGMVSVWTGTAPPPAALAAAATTPADSTTVTGTIHIRAPHTAVSEAILLNPGSALGLGALIGSGDELYSPAVTSAAGVVSVQRDRYAYDLPRVSSYGPISRRVITSRITTNVATGFTRVDVAGGRWTPSCEVTVGLTPIDAYRTTLRWRAVLVGPSHRAFALGVRAVSGSRRAAGRASDPSETLADKKSRGSDAGVKALRAARSSSE